MREAANTKQIYPNNENDHPNKTGYSVIAKKIAEQLHQKSK